MTDNAMPLQRFQLLANVTSIIARLADSVISEVVQPGSSSDELEKHIDKLYEWVDTMENFLEHNRPSNLVLWSSPHRMKDLKQ